MRWVKINLPIQYMLYTADNIYRNIYIYTDIMGFCFPMSSVQTENTVLELVGPLFIQKVCKSTRKMDALVGVSTIMSGVAPF